MLDEEKSWLEPWQVPPPVWEPPSPESHLQALSEPLSVGVGESIPEPIDPEEAVEAQDEVEETLLKRHKQIREELSRLNQSHTGIIAEKWNNIERHSEQEEAEAYGLIDVDVNLVWSPSQLRFQLPALS